MAAITLQPGACRANPAPSRRAMLKMMTLGSVGIAVPVLAAPPAFSAKPLDRPDGGKWWRLYARMERIERQASEYDRVAFNPLWKAFQKANGGCPFQDTPERKALAEEMGLSEVGDRYERMIEVFCRLSDRLLELPAPDAKAALWKLGRLVGTDDPGTDSTPAWSKDYVEQTVADLRHFVGGAA